MAFQKATRKKSKLRLAIDGPTGSGKTLTALRMAMELARHEGAKAHRPGRIAVIDTEFGTASKYEGDVHDGHPIEFDVDDLSSFSPTSYTNAVNLAARMGFDVVVIDSLSHAWNGTDGALALVDKKAGSSGNSYTAWKDVTPLQNQMIESIIRCPIHVIVTMRSKMEYVLEVNERGKSVPRKVGMAPIQRQGVEYEFDILIDMDTDHVATMAKTRCSAIDGKVIQKPGAELMQTIIHWLEKGSDIPQELLNASRLVDAAELPAANGTATKPDTVSVEDTAARMARKKAEREAAAGGTTKTTPTAETTATAAPTPSPVASPTATPAPTPSPSLAEKSAVTMASPAQQLEISTYFDVMDVPPEGRADTLKKRGANSIAELTEVHAGDLLKKLRGLPGVDHAKVAGVMSAPVAAGTATAAATADGSVSTAVPAADGSAPITGIQQDRTRRLFEQLQVPNEARVMAYQKRDVNALVDMTSAAADDLTLNLLTKLSKDELAITLKSMELEAWADRIATGVAGK